MLTEGIIERLKILVISAAREGNTSADDNQEYVAIRRDLMAEPELRSQLPRFLLIASSLKEVRQEMQEVSPKWKDRERFIREELRPLLNNATPQQRDLFTAVVTATDLSNLATLPQDIQQKGKEGANCFVYLFCIENSIREFIIQVTKSATVRIPRVVQAKVDARKLSEANRKYLPVRGSADVYYCDFIELADIVKANWEVFAQYFPSKNEHWFSSMMDELYAVRLLIGHNSAVGDVELRQLDVFYRILMTYLKLGE